jgi:hypothetical protein
MCVNASQYASGVGMSGINRRAFVIRLHSAQQESASVSPYRCPWIGGHGTEPKEQNTQQSPSFGRSITPQPEHL